MKWLDFLEKKGVITGEVLGIFLVVVAAYVYSLATVFYVHNYILELASSFWALGGLGNLYVISFNGNKMPVPAASRIVGAMRKKHPERGICKLTSRTKLAWLADRIEFLNRYWSMGDVVISIGIILFFVEALVKLLPIFWV